MVLGTNIAVLLDCSKSSRQCSLHSVAFLTYLLGQVLPGDIVLIPPTNDVIGPVGRQLRARLGLGHRRSCRFAGGASSMGWARLAGSGAAQPRLQPWAHPLHPGEVLSAEPLPVALAPSELGCRLPLRHGLCPSGSRLGSAASGCLASGGVRCFCRRRRRNNLRVSSSPSWASSVSSSYSRRACHAADCRPRQSAATPPTSADGISDCCSFHPTPPPPFLA